MVQLLRLRARDSSRISFVTATEHLWPTWNPSSSWEIADSFLEVIAASVQSFNCEHLDESQKLRLRTVTEVALKSTHLYLRSSAFKLLAALCAAKLLEDE